MIYNIAVAQGELRLSWCNADVAWKAKRYPKTMHKTLFTMLVPWSGFEESWRGCRSSGEKLDEDIWQMAFRFEENGCL